MMILISKARAFGDQQFTQGISETNRSPALIWGVLWRRSELECLSTRSSVGGQIETMVGQFDSILPLNLTFERES